MERERREESEGKGGKCFRWRPGAVKLLFGWCCIDCDGLDSSKGAGGVDSGNLLELPLLGNEHGGGSGDSHDTSRQKAHAQRTKHSWRTIPLEQVAMHKRIGQGAFGVVFEGKYDGKAVAVKEVDREEWEWQTRLSKPKLGGEQGNTGDMSSMDDCDVLREASILSKLRHPNTVHFFGVAMKRQPASTTVSSYYFVTELCSTTLDNIPLGLYNPRLESRVELWEMLFQVAKGMHYLHSKKILHRDLKPQNVLVNENAGVDARRVYKVCDFGLSKVLHTEARHSLARQDFGST